LDQLNQDFWRGGARTSNTRKASESPTSRLTEELKQMVRAHEFREDMYYRLNIFFRFLCQRSAKGKPTSPRSWNTSYNSLPRGFRAQCKTKYKGRDSFEVRTEIGAVMLSRRRNVLGCAFGAVIDHSRQH